MWKDLTMANDLGFGIQTFTAFGTSGEFAIGEGESRTVAKYLLTRIRPGNEGAWENTLARKLRPWREVFSVGKVTFDELLQRDLDDSRVAMDMIPYLLGEGRNVSRFFPPILAIVVPLRADRSGIQDAYPSFANGRFGNLFRVDPFSMDGTALPLEQLVCNDAKAGFVIADGQHRAMAVLALHRILTHSWERDPYATYYQHIQVSAEQVSHIELPVCIVYFPELTDDNATAKERGITLTKVCRDLFLTVNKSAKIVSKSRQLLLDDGDFAARMMRSSLSKMKDRPELEEARARIYSFAFGDADTDLAAQDVTGRLEYASALLLYRVHAATCFTNAGNLSLDSEKDLTDQRSLKSPSRAPELLSGTTFGEWNGIDRNAGRTYPEEHVREIVELLGEVSDIPLFAMYDRFATFTAHNVEMSNARTHLSGEALRADPVQAKAASLLFEGSGARGIFEQHCQRIRDVLDEAKDDKVVPPQYFVNQEKDVRAVQRALEAWDQRIKRGRAMRFLRIEPSEADKDQVGSDAERLTRTLFQTTCTQAFQLGFVVGVHGAVRLATDGAVLPHDTIKRFTSVIASAWVAGMNAYFLLDGGSHRTVTQDMKASLRLGVFDTDREGLRAILGLSVRELNESQYVFFRYACLELVHCPRAIQATRAALRADEEVSQAYMRRIEAVARTLVDRRKYYLERGSSFQLNSGDAKLRIAEIRAVAASRGEDPEVAVRAFEDQQRATVREKFDRFLKAAVGNAHLDAGELSTAMVAS